MHRHLGTALRSTVVCSLLLLTAGCADGDPVDPPTSAQEAREPAEEPAQTQTPVPSPSAGQTTPPTDGLQKLRVVGVVERSGDCVVVRDDNGTTWTITGVPAKDLPTGARVAVTGAPDLAATGCGGPLVRATRVSPVG